MVDPTLALQKLLQGRLLASPDVVALVDPDDIGDIGALPTTFPCINIGEGTAVYSNNYDTFHEWASCTVHVWTEEAGLQRSKEITHAVREALKQAPWQVPGFACHAINVSSARFLRDPSGEHGHAVLTIDAVLQTRAAA